MLWTLRPRLVSKLLQSQCYSTAARTRPDFLRILFCGSDDFSIKSLRALHRARQDTPGLIEAIHVAHRPAKPTGRGLKVLREVPIAATASSLALPTHTIDTFTGWQPPFAYNLVIAVSFGLLVPPRILALAKYGGLNVHPSLLPDLRGSAPIEHAILKNRTHTGVSLQTLHPTRFDEGVILRQTPPPGLEIRAGETAAQLKERLGQVGADMLVDVLREGKFLEPVEPAGWYRGATEHAPKIGKQDAFVDFGHMSVLRVCAANRALGDVWCRLPNAERLVVHEVAAAAAAAAAAEPSGGHGPTGLFVGEDGRLMFRAQCGGEGLVVSSTYPGGRKGCGNSKVVKILKGHVRA